MGPPKKTYAKPLPLALGAPIITSRIASLLKYPAQSWKPDSCPLCQKGIPLESRGRTGKR